MMKKLNLIELKKLSLRTKILTILKSKFAKMRNLSKLQFKGKISSAHLQMTLRALRKSLMRKMRWTPFKLACLIAKMMKSQKIVKMITRSLCPHLKIQMKLMLIEVSWRASHPQNNKSKLHLLIP